MIKKVFVLAHDQARKLAAQACQDEPDGTIVRFLSPAKSRAQEERYHAMIGDIARAVPIHGRHIDPDDMKRVLVSAFKIDTKDDPELAKAWREMGELAVLPGLRGEFVVLGTATRKFPRELASAFIEWLFAFGAEHEVAWSNEKREPATC